jgi:GNAT superfamily N-acetyltransferase
VIIRDSAPDDWPRIWPFFHEIVAAGDTFAYPLDLTYEQSHDLWMLDPPKRTTVAQDEAGAILGSATMYANRGGNGDHVASASYMVDPKQSGHGVGRALVEESLTWARAQGFRAMQFNAVVETNIYAVKLYQKLGFEIIGTVPEAFNHPTTGYVGLHVMYIKL